MTTQLIMIPEMPAIGLGETIYGEMVQTAQRWGNALGRDAAKVGQYVTLALARRIAWPEKLRYFKHTLSRHCKPPPFPDEHVWMFYQDLANLVRSHAGAEALCLASREDDLYALQLQNGRPRCAIENDAEIFFAELVAPQCPYWLNQEDYRQLKLIRDHWI
jgi:hypothetical protein